MAAQLFHKFWKRIDAIYLHPVAVLRAVVRPIGSHQLLVLPITHVSEHFDPAPRQLRGPLHKAKSLSVTGEISTDAVKFLANKLRVSIVAAGTYEALHVMRADPQIASRFEEHELPVWTESQELRRFIAGYLALLPVKKSTADINKQFVEYLLELSEMASLAA